MSSILLRVTSGQRSLGLITPARTVFTHDDLLKYRAKNERVDTFLKGSPERKGLEAALKKWGGKTTQIPIIIGDKEMQGTHGAPLNQPRPYDHANPCATYSYAGTQQLSEAIESSLKARKAWANRPHHERAEVFLKAADLCSGKYRYDLLATTVLGQAKTAIQAEIDAVAELADFMRFNVQFLGDLLKYKPISTDKSTNQLFYRGNEGFWAAVSPFNFTAIGGNLCLSPATMGNVVLWKPSDTAMLSNYLVYQILREAGLPPNVIQFTPAEGKLFGDTVTAHSQLAGVNFTGSVPTFNTIWGCVTRNLDKYNTFPRMVGELGGKNFHLVHPTAVTKDVINGTLMSAFEFGGQKCSACSRMYVPQSMWPDVKKGLADNIAQFKVGNPEQFDTFVSAVIDGKSYDRISGYIAEALKDSSVELIAGGKFDNSKGFFINPTVLKVSDPQHKLMREEIFGPVLSVYVYPDAEFDKVVDLVNTTSPYALTGAIFCNDDKILKSTMNRLWEACGNMYINERSTGSVVGQQPFGGARRSGTNDKAGGPHYLLKFASPITVKTTKGDLPSWKYPYMSQ